MTHLHRYSSKQFLEHEVCHQRPPNAISIAMCTCAEQLVRLVPWLGAIGKLHHSKELTNQQGSIGELCEQVSWFLDITAANT